MNYQSDFCENDKIIPKKCKEMLMAHRFFVCEQTPLCTNLLGVLSHLAFGHFSFANLLKQVLQNHNGKLPLFQAKAKIHE